MKGVPMFIRVPSCKTFLSVQQLHKSNLCYGSKYNAISKCIFFLNVNMLPNNKNTLKAQALSVVDVDMCIEANTLKALL